MGKWLRYCIGKVRPVAGVSIFIVGLAGVPDDLATWYAWVDAVVTDPFVLAIASKMLALAGLVNESWFRVALILIGIVTLLWPLRWFWRLRHKLKFRWRHILSEQVWISKLDALELIRQSDWGRLKEPRLVQHVNVLDALAINFSRERVVRGMSDWDRKILKYNVFVDRTLEKFAEANPRAKRTVESGEEFDETALRAFLKQAMDAEMANEFGDIPTFRVT